MKPIYLTAHYDDFEICAGGTATRYGGLSVVLHPRERHGTQQQAERAAQHLGVETINATKHVADRNVVEWLDAVAEPYDTIISTSPYDSHPEHRAVASIARQLNRRNTKTLLFMDHAIPGGIGGPRPDTFISFEDWVAKELAVYEYEAMIDLYGNRWPAAAADRDRLYGYMTGTHRAEGFITAARSIP